MDEMKVDRYITETFADIEVQSVGGTNFYFYDPERKFPFVTLVTNDDHDQASDLNRPGVYRLNIGVGRPTFLALFGRPFSPAVADEYDFTALDRLLPHPVYGSMFWLSILNPSAATFATAVRPLLDEAYGMAVEKFSRRRAPRA